MESSKQQDGKASRKVKYEKKNTNLLYYILLCNVKHTTSENPSACVKIAAGFVQRYSQGLVEYNIGQNLNRVSGNSWQTVLYWNTQYLRYCQV